MITLCTSLACLLILSVAGILGARLRFGHGIVYGGSAMACGLIAALALARLAGVDIGGDRMVLPVGLPWLSAHLRLDSLSAFFLALVNVTGVTASVFGWGYDRPGRDHGHAAAAPGGPVQPLYPLFLAGMNLVLLADDAFVLLVSWEFMSVASWLLVLSTHRDSGTSFAARVYLVMAGVGTVALLFAFGLLAGGPLGDYGFSAIRANVQTPAMATLAVLLVLAGAGSKAGLVPLHVWLPLAHPAAPSHVSALMSGVMTKVAIYVLVRVLFDLVGTPQWWWGAVLLAFGALTAVLGVLYALFQDDLKRLLAYSTVENIGVLVIALGLALVFKANGEPMVAALSLGAALLHALNHSLFKSLLFFGAGAVMSATGERDLNRLGGLIHRMPVTAFTCLIGAAAISALPPLNGFVSEWLVFQAILNGPRLPQWEYKIGIAVLGALAALAAALAAACFVRMYGVAFLGRPRSAEAAAAREVPLSMQVAMVVPAALCVAVGVMPSPVLALFNPITIDLVGTTQFYGGETGPWLWLAPASAIGNSYSGLIVLGVIGALSAVLAVAIHKLASDRVRRSIPWGCGFTDDPGPVSQYSAASFSQPLRRVFGAVVFRAREEVDMPAPGETRAARHVATLRDPAWDLIYTPIGRAVDWLADRSNFLQFMTIRRYLVLMFMALVVVLVMVAVSQS